MKQASYRHAIATIALNDEPTDFDPESVAAMASVLIISVIFDVDQGKVAQDVVRFRKKEEAEERKTARKEARFAHASREEQNASLIDCGYQNWDDRGD